MFSKLRKAAALFDLEGFRIEAQGGLDLAVGLVVPTQFGQAPGLDRVGLGQIGVELEGPFGGGQARVPRPPNQKCRILCAVAISAQARA